MRTQIFGSTQGFSKAGVALVLAGTLLSSCDQSSYMAGIDGSGARVFAEGPIEAFGSIVVGGEHYELSRAEIRINGELATESDLALGQVVTVRAQVDANGIALADTVDFDANLVGPVQSVDVQNGVVIVLEQRILVDSGTELDLGSGAGLDSLAAGDPIEISGLAGSGGLIDATRISRATSAAGLRIVGRVGNLDIATFSFTIGNLVVDYSNAGLIEGFPGGSPADGDEVLVIGRSLNSSGVLVTESLALINDGMSENSGDEAEVEGLITRFISPIDFDVAGNRSTTTAQTAYEGGTQSDLQVNVKIQIEGEFDAQGTIVASKIEVKDGGAVQQ